MHTHARRHSGIQEDFVDADASFYSQLHKDIHLTLLGLTPACAKWANPIFSQLFLPFGMIPINSEHAGKQETWPVKTFMAFPAITQDYNGVFMMLLYNPSSPNPPYHQGK